MAKPVSSRMWRGSPRSSGWPASLAALSRSIGRPALRAAASTRSMLPVAALHYERYMLLVFDECAVPVDFYGKPCGPTINWRTPITHASTPHDAFFCLFCLQRRARS